LDAKFQLTTVKRGEGTRLSCNATGDQPLTIYWTKDSTKISKGSSYYEVTDSLTDRGMKSELVLRRTSREDNGIYMCVAENSFGRDDKSNKVLVLESPVAPSQVFVRNVWSRSASISWVPSSGIPLSGFVVQSWKETERKETETTVPASQTELLLSNLSPGTVYEVCIVAVNDVGRSPASSVLKFKSGEEEPSAPPMDVYAEAKGPTTIRVSWKPPPQSTWNGEPQGFYVGFKATHDSHYSFRTIDFWSFNESFEHFIPGLMQRTQYHVVVKAFNLAGTGPESQVVSAKTYGGDFIGSPKMMPIDIKSDEIALQIHLPPSVLDQNRNLMGFTLNMREDSNPVYRQVSIPGNERDVPFVAKHLNPSSLYHFFVVASTATGQGDPSALLSIRTKGIDFSSNSISMASIIASQGQLQLLVMVLATSVIIATIIVSFACLKQAKLKSKMIPPPVVDYFATLARPSDGTVMTMGRARAGGVGEAAVFVAPRYIGLNDEAGNLMQGNVQVHRTPCKAPRKSYIQVDPNVYDLPHH